MDLTLNFLLFFVLFWANSTRKPPKKESNNSHGKKSNVEKFEMPKIIPYQKTRSPTTQLTLLVPSTTQAIQRICFLRKGYSHHCLFSFHHFFVLGTWKFELLSPYHNFFPSFHQMSLSQFFPSLTHPTIKFPYHNFFSSLTHPTIKFPYHNFFSSLNHPSIKCPYHNSFHP